MDSCGSGSGRIDKEAEAAENVPVGDWGSESTRGPSVKLQRTAGEGEGGEVAKKGLGAELIVELELWPVIAGNLSLGERAVCSRVCRAWKVALQEDGFDYGLATLAERLARDKCGRNALEALFGPGVERRGDPVRMGEVQDFLKKYEMKRFMATDTWLKLALREPDDGWLCRAAKRMRVKSYLYGKDCALQWTPLHMAVLLEDLEGVKQLVSSGADKAPNNPDFTFPLHLAAEKGYMDMVVALLDGEAGPEEEGEGALVMSRNRAEWTPLFSAAKNGHIHVVRYLVQKGGNSLVTATDLSGGTALFVACQNGHREVAEFLVELGGSSLVLHKDRGGGTALFAASRSGSLGCCKLMVAGGGEAQLLEKDKTGWSVLMSAACWGRLSVVEYLVEVGGEALMTMTDKGGWTALFTACWKGHVDVVKFLALAGGERLMLANSNDGDTVLAFAVRGKKKEMVDFLSANGGGSVPPPRRRRESRDLCQLGRRAGWRIKRMLRGGPGGCTCGTCMDEDRPSGSMPGAALDREEGGMSSEWTLF